MLDAVDVSPEALQVAQKNVEIYGLEVCLFTCSVLTPFQDRIKLQQSNMFASVPNAAYDVIISNPPYERRPLCALRFWVDILICRYVPSDVVAELPAEFKHEPKLAFDAGKDGALDSLSVSKLTTASGFKFISEIMKKAPDLLSDKGILSACKGCLT
jgi:ribosomal protein L3 glutamine methyltransferase